MTRKDYILLAGALQQVRRPIAFSAQSRTVLTDVKHYYEDVLDGIDKAVSAVSAELVRDNPKFDAQHFLSVVRGEEPLTSRPARKGSVKEADPGNPARARRDNESDWFDEN